MTDSLQRITDYLSTRDAGGFQNIDLIHSMKQFAGGDAELLESDLRALVSEVKCMRGRHSSLVKLEDPCQHGAIAEIDFAPASQRPASLGGTGHIACAGVGKSKVMSTEEHAVHFDLSGEFTSTREALCGILEPLAKSTALTLSREYLKSSSFKRIFINGPLLNGRSCNRSQFHKAAEVLRHSKWHVCIPLAYGGISGTSWTDFMQLYLGQLATCDSLFALPHWSKSKGASLLMHFAYMQGIEILYAEGAETYMDMPGVHLTRHNFAEQVAQRQHADNQTEEAAAA